VTDQIDEDSSSRAAAPLWLRILLLLTVGLLLFAVARLLGKWAGSQRSASAIAGALWSTLLIFQSARRRHSQLRGALIESIVAGAGIGAVMWVFL
jgi:hypothetical protein